jgi:hypothetical protein
MRFPRCEGRDRFSYPRLRSGVRPASDMRARRMIFCRALSCLMTRIRSPRCSQFSGWGVHQNATFPDNTESRSCLHRGTIGFWEGRTAKATAAVGVLPYPLILWLTTPLRFYAYDTPSIFHLIDRRLLASTELNARCRRSTLSYHRAGDQRAACLPRSFLRWDV